jgi:hypothetical protein
MHFNVNTQTRLSIKLKIHLPILDGAAALAGDFLVMLVGGVSFSDCKTVSLKSDLRFLCLPRSESKNPVPNTHGCFSNGFQSFQ